MYLQKKIYTYKFLGNWELKDLWYGYDLVIKQQSVKKILHEHQIILDVSVQFNIINA